MFDTPPGASIQAAKNGALVPVGPGLDATNAIDPAGSTTPLQDAIDDVSNAGFGAVLLPPESFDEGATVDLARGVGIRGWGRQASQINFTSTGSSAHGFVADANLDGALTQFRDFQISGPGEGQTTGDGWRITGNTSRTVISGVQIIGWGNRAFAIDGGFTTGCRIDHLRIQNINPETTGAANTPAVLFDSAGPGLSIGTLSIQTDQSGGNLIPLDMSGGTLSIQAINMGGQPDFINHSGGTLCIGLMNYEPADQDAVNAAINCVAADSGDALYVDALALNDAQNALNVNHAYRLNGVTRGRLAKPTLRSGASLGTNVIDNDSTSTGIIYEGPSGDVAENSGGTVSPGISCLEDLTVVT